MGKVTQPIVVAVDGGGSKTDAVAVALDGRVVGRATGPGGSPHFIGVPAAAAQIDALIREVAGAHPIAQVNVYLSGLDLPSEVDTFAEALRRLDWSSERTVVDNDLYALLRTGTDATDAVAVVCGTGINALGRRADGLTARFAALGIISGDWGGGAGLGEAAVWHSARHADRRGPETTLTAEVPRFFGLSTMDEVTQALHLGSLEYGDLAGLAPLVQTHADAGDEIAGQLLVRQGEEVAIMAASCLDRLDLLSVAVPVVLGGGVLAARNPRLWGAMLATLSERAPLAVPIHVPGPPILGAAMLALEKAGASPEIVAKLVVG
ncbi:MAG TPA: BadF/BadG/BcrA/BcrD ATPase family protein [Galbitalea sp.]|nr:BadF/BadG/BcrA/BcrD ATPase family protein [Galbitalea sp.]